MRNELVSGAIKAYSVLMECFHSTRMFVLSTVSVYLVSLSIVSLELHHLRRHLIVRDLLCANLVGWSQFSVCPFGDDATDIVIDYEAGGFNTDRN